MLHSSPNRATPVSVDNITKLVRQNYKPVAEQEYSHEKVLCRTETNCQKSKPEDYWTTNFRRRQCNLQKGFYTSSTEPYRPIGGQLILDPCELVLSNIPGSASRKLSPQMTRRGTIFEEQKTTAGPSTQEKGEDESLSDSCLGLEDTAPSAGYDDIKKLLKESRHRIISVRAGRTYEDHVRAVEEANNREKQSNKHEDSGMVVKSVSSTYMATQTNKSQPSAQSESGMSSRSSNIMSGSDKLTISDIIRTPTTSRKGSAVRTILRPPSMKNKLTLMQVGGGITAVMLRKERQFRDHLLFLGSIYNILTALHNLKVKDIRSKVPLSKEVVERLQKENSREEDNRGSMGAYVSRAQGKRRESRFSAHSFRVGVSSKRTSMALSEIFGDIGDDELSPRKYSQLLPKIKRPSVSRGKGTQLSMMHMEGEQGDVPGGRLSVFNAAKRLNTVEFATKSVFGRSLRDVRKGSTQSRGSKEWFSGNTVTAIEALLKKIALADQVNKTVIHFKGCARRSKNAANISNDRQALETWEDLLNVQPEPYKEGSPGGGGGVFFQVGVLAKFMRWHRRATIVPSAGLGTIDKKQLSQLQEIHEKGPQAVGSQAENEAPPNQQHPGSAAQTTERVKKLPIWQQVAQEKSTVFQNLKQTAPNPEGTIQRLRRNLIKLKRSIQKENTATLEKIVRERVANFRLKFSTLDCEECSPLFDEQKIKLHGVKDNVKKSHLENFDIQPSKWFEELKETTVTLVSSYHQPQLFDMLSKVQNYAHMDNKTVSYAKAKLCLLMMSLPAYDICQIYTQKALKFIFENILLGQEAQFYEWLNHRKIPNMVVSDTVSRSGTSTPASPFRDASSLCRDSVSPSMR